jgi:hypothetical protein
MLPMPSVGCLTVKAWLRQLLMLMLQEDIGLSLVSREVDGSEKTYCGKCPGMYTRNLIHMK